MDVVWLVLVGLGAGSVSAIVGVGGGIIVVPALIWMRGFDVKLAVGTSLAYIVPTALAGTLRTPADKVDYRVAAWLAAGGIVGAVIGAWLAPQLPSLWIKRGFAVLLVLVAAKLFFETT